MSIHIKKHRYTRLNQRQLDIIHVPLWILKDTFWMMEYKTLGLLMIIPTLSVAIILCFKSYKYIQRFLLNLTVLCWISANALWMVSDFYEWPTQWISLILFGTGLITTAYFFYVRKRIRQNSW
jgi:hypothetical protein